MDGVLSQEEINALLNNNDAADSSDEILTESEKDAIGEIANISMGTAATTLFSLVNRRVEISTPVVSFSNWDKIVDEYEKPCVFIKIGYTQGLNGSNILVLKEKDVKIITDLMMGGDGTNINGEIGELHLSAISEAMNQMMGSSATSLSSMLNRTIDISPPIAEVVDLKNTLNEGGIDSFLSEEFVKISFHMEIGDLVDSEIMQLYPPAFVKEMCKGVSQNMELDTQSVTEDVPQSSNTATQAAPIQQPQDSGSMNNASANSQGMIKDLDKIADMSAEELKIITEKEVTAAKKDLSDALDEEITQKQDETKRSLEKEANSKIMAINEYSDTVLDSINKAHNEIMFLYSMLNDKHDELTRLSGDIDKASSRLRSSFEPLSADSAKRAEKPSVAVQKPAEPKSGTMQQDTKLDMKQMTGIDISGIIKTQPASAAPASKAGATATTGTAAAVSVKASDAAFGTPAGSSANADVINHTHEILKLYKSGKSNVEIAKLLSLGTGEVKLIIDLYKEGK